MKNINVSLNHIVSNINLPTVIKTAILPGDSIERLFIATQVGEIFYLDKGTIKTLLDIRPQIIKLGASGGYDERGLLGLAFHPKFQNNGLFYVHYSVAGTQGPGALSEYNPDPCNPKTLNNKWTNRENNYDHIDTVEEWSLQGTQVRKIRTLLNIRRPFFNHNGVNSLNFSPESGKLVLTTGDGGLRYDPFNLSQNDIEIAGKIIEIDVTMNTYLYNPPIVTRFYELPIPIQRTLTVIAKGVRNMPGISYQRYYNKYIKYVGNVGQDLVESIYSFINYKPIPVTQLVQAYLNHSQINQEGFINFGWRGWEGSIPTSIFNSCTNKDLDEKIIAYYNEALETSILRLHPLTCYYHKDERENKFEGSALTGVQSYNGNIIPDLKDCVVFTDFTEEGAHSLGRGTLAYSRIRSDCKLNDYGIINIDYDFSGKSAFYTCLGANRDQTRLYLGVYGSMNVSDLNKGNIYEIIK